MIKRLLLMGLGSIALILATPAQNHELRKISNWYNQKPIDLNKNSVLIGYNYRSINRSYNGFNIGYLFKSGFEVGISTFSSYNRLERLKMLYFSEAYIRYRIFNLWKNGYFDLMLSYVDTKYLPSNSLVRLQNFICNVGISHIFRIKYFGRLGVHAYLTECDGEYGFNGGIIKLL